MDSPHLTFLEEMYYPLSFGTMFTFKPVHKIEIQLVQNDIKHNLFQMISAISYNCLIK